MALKIWESPVYARFITYLAIALIVILVSFFFWPRADENGWLAQLSQAELGRGMITLLVVLVTGIVAVSMVVLALFFSGDAALKDRFSMGKEVLTIFVGLLGTLFGFYYSENRVSPENVQKIAETVQKADAPASIGELEKKAFDALTAKDFDAAAKTFAEAFRVNPTWHNVAELNKLFNSQKDAYTAAVAAKDDNKKAEVWKNIYCTIGQKSLTVGMTAEMIAGIKKNCDAAVPGANPANTNTAIQPTGSPTGLTSRSRDLS